MAEVLPSSFRFSKKETVDTVFSKLIIAQLFKDETFKPGITFNDEYNERAGQIYMRRLGKVEATVKDATSEGGLKFTHTNTADSLVLIQKKDVIAVSEECYDLVDSLRASGKSVDKASAALAAFKEKCQVQYMSYLLAEPAAQGAVVVGGAVRSANTTAAKDLAELIMSVLADRKQIRVNGGIADTLIISPDAENLFLANAYKPGNAFVPETNEEMLRTGKIGKLYNMNVFTSNLIGSGTPAEGTVSANTGDAEKCEYIIYDHKAFGIAVDIEGARQKDATDFIGSYAQIQALAGGGICNPALAIAKINA